MAIWDRLRAELDRAGRVAQHAFDEGRLRLELLRARRQADAGAQRLGYALFKATNDGRTLAPEEYAGLARVIENAEAEAERYRRLIDEAIARRRAIATADDTAAAVGAASADTPGAPNGAGTT